MPSSRASEPSAHRFNRGGGWPAKAALIPSEAVTVVLSEKGWVRAAKGHEVDPAGLNYKAEWKDA